MRKSKAAQFKAAQFRAAVDLHRKEIAKHITYTTEKLSEQIGESYVRELEDLTDSEAIQYLRSVDAAKVIKADLILSKRLDRTMLAEVYLDYMKRREPDVRLVGAMGIGKCLKGTGNKEASHALALMIRNPEEADVLIRVIAHSSLELINCWRVPQLSGTGDEDKVFALLQKDTLDRNDLLQTIDWSLVDSYLSPEEDKGMPGTRSD